jgi:hypothetical protein
MHDYCVACERVFDSPAALLAHYANSKRHFYCTLCQTHWQDKYDLIEYKDTAHYPCGGCGVYLRSELAGEQHAVQAHAYYTPCRSFFQNDNNLDAVSTGRAGRCLRCEVADGAYLQHLTSSIHQPRNCRCPGRRCNQAFVSASALALHLETGRCVSGIIRAMIDRYVTEHDPGIFTDPSRRIEGGARSRTVVTYIATEQPWHGSGYECYFCHDVFARLTALNAHLASPRHSEKIYRCPNTSGCRAKFSTLSGCWQHIESSNCGVKKFAGVNRAMEELTREVRAIAF